MTVRQITELVKASNSVLVLGAGVTGYSASLVFSAAGNVVTVLDENEIPQEIALELQEHRISLASQFDISNFDPSKYDFVVKSPGIPKTSAMVKCLREADAKFVSELDLSYVFSGKPTVAVTGTNGKTTVCKLINQMFVESGLRSKLLGNVGRPLIGASIGGLIAGSKLESELFHASRDVVELSSYQLEDSNIFAPRVGICLNLSEDHLDRHGTMNSYLAAKARLFHNQDPKDDWSMINMDDPYAAKLRSSATGTFFPFGTLTPKLRSAEWGCFYDEKSDCTTFLAGKLAARFELTNSALQGYHNKINLTAAIAAALLNGAKIGAIEHVINNFQPLPHRMEPVGVVSGVKYINDSKSTNSSSALAALKVFQRQPQGTSVYFLLGGKPKETPWGEFAKKALELEIRIVLFGTEAQTIAKGLASVGLQISENSIFPSLEKATLAVASVAQEGDTVVLSPGCSSFDAYRNFEERGRDFRSLVNQLSSTQIT